MQLFIKNKTNETIPAILVTNPTADLQNLGPNPAVVVYWDKAMAMAVAPDTVTPEPGVKNEVVSSMEGVFVVEVNGVIMPHTFTEKTLPRFFNQEDLSGTGIVFEPTEV